LNSVTCDCTPQRGLLAQPTPQHANKKPYRHGTDAPRHYPHTLINPLNSISSISSIVPKPNVSRSGFPRCMFCLSRCDLFRTAHYYLVSVFCAIWIWNLNFECVCCSLFWVFVCLSRCRLLFLDGKMVDFGGCSLTALAFYAPGNGMDDVASLKMDAPLWNKEKASLFGDFWHITMILHIWALQRPFSKLKKHSPTHLYMLYPMVQSVVLVFVEKVKKRALQGHCPLSSSIVHRGPKTKSFWRAGPLLPKSKWACTAPPMRRCELICHINN
jgi:hypothetical protein